MLDVLIVGAGPAGLSGVIEASNRNLDYLVIDKGCVINSIYNNKIFIENSRHQCDLIFDHYKEGKG